ncbi:alpha/beta hydrolase fold family protein [Xylanimonas cellulosilytica DSM 15894]|uniref:Alpha/beta hydrolase fold family protein n=1 Tax=Xylanimonas cellulosilytica (strain DSM 15894 / JCM 12276 / CECT 5975 / KCTC 9989 / LMG 20990 / NBRC 107835 / XIL07) TaxID=446471 RepID=D1BTD5_XYLCX|nr:alpha/beta hydrolase [Xylanimonas cellulosilytica]ACZ29077.1 alpha/beta hydrolase fold family protein [Xylanimonas cellulosilytica DSM 15894]
MSATPPEQTWLPDVLPGFEQLTLPLADDDEGEVVATLVRRERPGPTDAGVDLLYVHGWIDYFHQVHVADLFEGLGIRFHALDLRKYGRSLRDHQTPGYVSDLRTYDEELEAALAVLGHGEGGATDRKLLLMGHSTGGLTLPLWADRHPGRADALILNAPWLEFQTRYLGRRVLEGPVRAQAAVAPRSHLVNVDQGFYARTISRRFEGEWDYDERWRPDLGWRATPAWLAAVFSGHERVAQGLHIDVPILVLLSARSTPPVRWSEDLKRTDSVLDVPGIMRRVPNLGTLVTLARFEGALHDVTLSERAVRDQVWREITRWVGAYVTPPAPAPEPRRPWWHRFWPAP